MPSMQVELRIQGYANDFKFEKFSSILVRAEMEPRAEFNNHILIQVEG